MADPVHELKWHDDGHSIYLRLEQSNLRVSPMPCPHDESPEADCFHKGLGGCLVRYFVQMYGLDVNVGVADPEAEMLISWARQGDDYSLDDVQVWIIPNTDTRFAEFLEAQRELDNEAPAV
jgi:hypothetical protein